jgi:hypothetical protein
MEFALIVLGFAMFFFFVFKRKVGGPIGLSIKVESSFISFLEDDLIMKDFSKILKEDVELVRLLSMIKAWKTKLPDGDINWLALISLTDETKKYFDFQPDAFRISKKLIESNSYQVFAQKRKFNERDNEVMELLIYWMILRDNFKYMAVNVYLGKDVRDDSSFTNGYRKTYVTIADLVDLADRNSATAKKEKQNNL